jgi:hypothetical protein
MAKAVVQVEGAKQLRATMKRAGDDLADLTAVHGDIARLVASRGQANAPKRTGALAGSVRGSGTKTVATVRAGGARIPYAMVIHYGWPAHNISANPFLTSAAHDTEPIWTNKYVDAVNRILARVKGI